MSWSNDTSVTAGPDPVSAASLFVELLFHHGFRSVEFIFVNVLPILSNVIFILYTRYHFSRITPQTNNGYIEPKKKGLSFYLAIFELVVLALQAVTGGLDMTGLAAVNHLMGFVAAVTGLIIFDKESEKGYPLSKSIYFYVVLWIAIDVFKMTTYMNDFDTRLLTAGGYANAYIRSRLLTAMLAPSPLTDADLLTVLCALEAEKQRAMPQPTPEHTEEDISGGAWEDPWLAWQNKRAVVALRSSRAIKSQKKYKNMRNLRRKAD